MSLKSSLSHELDRRVLAGGGFADRLRGQFRVDATAWGVLASQASGYRQDILEQHSSRLMQEQGGDGRIHVSSGHPESYWPTALSILAWQGSSVSHSAQQHAIRFLVDTTGIHFAKQLNSPSAHDTSLKGWPWIENTHSWVEPTAMCIIALRAVGYGHHARVQEAIQMILDRQLPHGGWNAGNTIVFGKELHPMPEGTGSALASLAGIADEQLVAQSLEYLERQVDRLRTPISLGWTLLGLAAWGRKPSDAIALVERCLANQSRYGEYDTSSLCLLVLGGLVSQADIRTPVLQLEQLNQARSAGAP